MLSCFYLPQEKAFFFWSIEYGAMIITSLMDAVNHRFLKQNVIESESSVYTDGVPGVLTTEIMIRKIQITLTCHTLSPYYTISFLQHIHAYFWIIQCRLREFSITLESNSKLQEGFIIFVEICAE